MQLLQKKKWALPISLILFSAVMQGGPITVTPTVTANGALFHYDYSIGNGTGNDLAVLDLMVTPGAGTIQGLSAPAGFQFAYDPVLGLVSFLEDAGTFGTTSISGFAFNSPFQPRATTFTGTLLDANFNVSTMTGSTSGPLAGPAVPEPTYLPLMALGATAFWLVYRRTRVHAQLSKY